MSVDAGWEENKNMYNEPTGMYELVLDNIRYRMDLTNSYKMVAVPLKCGKAESESYSCVIANADSTVENKIYDILKAYFIK